MDSNGAWGEMSHNDAVASVFDSYEHLPERGTNAALDAFVDRKRISIEALVKLGARMSEWDVIAYGHPNGIKFRDLVTDKAWSYDETTYNVMRIVRAGRYPSKIVIVAEGETDGARLTMLYPDIDVAVLPAGADPQPHTEAFAAQLNGYELVLLGHDPDAAGDNGAALLSEHLTTKTHRFPPPAADWCELEDAPPALPDPSLIVRKSPLISARDFLAMPTPEVVSYFEQSLLPSPDGQLILHGAKKSFKSFMAYDLGAALAQSQPWCGFEPTDEPVTVAVMQFEIPFAYWQERVQKMADAATDRELFLTNFLLWNPESRPKFVAGNVKSEDDVIRDLLADGVNVFILDPIRRAVGSAKINDEDGARPILHFFERLQREGIAVITTHHDNKSGERAGGGDSTEMTGSGAFGGDADTIISVGVPKGHNLQSPYRNLHFLLRNAPSPSARSMHMQKTGSIEYSTSAIEEAPADDGPTPGSSAPSI